MKILTTLMLLAVTSVELPAIAQMTLPQQRMIEYMHDVDGLNRVMEAANDAAKNKQSEADHVIYKRIALAAGALWLYTRRRRGAHAAKSGH